MFAVELLNGRPQRLFEAESGICMELTGSSHYMSRIHFRLEQDDFQFTFEARLDNAEDPTTGEGYGFYTFVRFGRLAGSSPKFQEPALERFWKLKAAAALVVFGGYYNGLEYPPEHIRVLIDGRLYTRLDFGYDA